MSVGTSGRVRSAMKHLERGLGPRSVTQLWILPRSAGVTVWIEQGIRASYRGMCRMLGVSQTALTSRTAIPRLNTFELKPLLSPRESGFADLVHTGHLGSRATHPTLQSTGTRTVDSRGLIHAQPLGILTNTMVEKSTLA